MEVFQKMFGGVREYLEGTDMDVNLTRLLDPKRSAT